MSKEKRRVPKLRFPGFTEDWEQRKVNEIFKVTRGQVLAASLTTPEKNRGNIYPVYSSQTKDNGLLGYYSEYLFENAITWTTDGANAGTVNFRPGRFYSTNVNGVLINENGYACYAVSEIINKVAYKYVSKVGNPKLMNNVMAEINIMITPNIDELKQISKLIEAYNQYITLHQRKLDNLKLKKKALLQKLFPKNGERYPELRFPGFTDAWEQRKLGDLLILLKDGSHGTHKNTDEGVYLLSAKNIKNGQINIMPDDRIISWEDYDVIHKNYELQFGDILLTIVGSIGETAIYNLKTKVTFQRSVAFLRPSSDLNNGFLYTLINTDRFQNQLQTKQVVSAQPGIYLGDLASIDITYPKNLSEQEKIYSIFKEIENSITLHQRKLDHLQLQKKALLQQMFV